MSEVVDARGLACPAPVVKTRAALKEGAKEIEVLVDNPTARDNVCRFASSQGCDVKVTEEEGVFRIAVTGQAPEEKDGTAAAGADEGGRKVIALTSDIMGRGDQELGSILIKAFLNTLAESERLPWRMVLFNHGVNLAVEGTDTAQALCNLENLGVEVLVCGTCLDYFCLKDRLAAGTVSNMYDILDTMLSASNSITI
ncbi:MAG: sulfurtransferase-like selenium metabolism protein YedF [Actinomycetota bacterium]